MAEIHQFPSKERLSRVAIDRKLQEFTFDLDPGKKEYLHQYFENMIKSTGSFPLFAREDIDLPEETIAKINALLVTRFTEYWEQNDWILAELFKLVKDRVCDES